MQTLSVKVDGWGEKVEVIGRNRRTVLSTQLYFLFPSAVLICRSSF